MPKIFLVIPLLGTVLGATSAYKQGVSLEAFLPNLLGCLIGYGLMVYLKTKTFKKYNIPAVFAAVAILSASLLFNGMEGVHRWIPLGPLQINASMIAVPLILYGMLFLEFKLLPLILLSITSLIHYLQPDLGQTMSFATAAMVLIILSQNISWLQKFAGILISFSAILLTGRQSDSLVPVSHVEHIFHLIISQPLGTMSVPMSIAMLVFPFILMFRMLSKEDRILPAAFGTYLFIEIAATEIGNFPVPVIGAGASPVIGYYLMLGLMYQRVLISTPNQMAETLESY